MKKSDRLMQERLLFQRRIWSHFCSKDYPNKISTQRFLIIILKQAKKTYHRNVRFYTTINFCDDNFFKKIINIDNLTSMLFCDITEVQQVFRVELQNIPKTKQDYHNFIDSIEDLKISIFIDYFDIYNKVLFNLENKNVA